MIIRSSAFHQTLRDGQLPVRFLGRLNHEYGYPVSTFLYPGFLYLAEPLRLLKFDEIESIKIILGASMLLSGVFFYLWVRKFFDKFAAFVGAIVYVYTPYHLYDLVTRGSVGELLALAIAPFILWQLERKNLVWSSLGIGILLISHNTLGLLFGGFIVCYLLLNISVAKKKDFKRMLPLLFGFGLSAFFWIPALHELQFTVFPQTAVANWQHYFASMALIGYSTFVVLLLTVILIVTKKIDMKKHRLTLLILLLGLGSLFLAIPLSSSLWKILPVGFVQFPFRFLSITTLCSAFLAACSVSLFPLRQKIAVAIFIMASLLFSSYPLLVATPEVQPYKDAGFYHANDATTTIQDEYLPVWVKEKSYSRAENKVEILNGKGKIDNILTTTTRTSFDVNSSNETIMRINTIYWPGWYAMLDGKETKISYNNAKGLMEIIVPDGKHHIDVSFRETPMRLFSDIVSLVSIICLLSLAFIKKKKGHE